MIATPGQSGGMSALAAATVSELPARPPGRVGADATIAAVVDEMKARGRGAVIVEDAGALVGIFTERDLISRLDHADAGWRQVRVRDVMTPQPIVIRPDDSLAEALHRLLAGRRRHLPIVDRAGRVLGLLSVRDLLVFIAGKFPEEMVNLPPAPDHEN